jgi:hypothetical protein
VSATDGGRVVVVVVLVDTVDDTIVVIVGNVDDTPVAGAVDDVVLLDAVTVVLVDSVAPAHVPSAAQASARPKRPSDAPHAWPFLHAPGEATIEAFTPPFFFVTQHTTASGRPQIVARSHCRTRARHRRSGSKVVRSGSFSVLFTQLLYLSWFSP